MNTTTKVSQLDLFDIPIPKESQTESDKVETKKSWIDALKEHLANNTGHALRSQSIITYEKPYTKSARQPYFRDDTCDTKIPESYLDTDKAQFMSDDMINHIDNPMYSYYQHIFNPLAHTRDGYTIESIFINKARYNCIVIDEAFLKQHKANYHVVILDAHEDYFYNYYPRVCHLNDVYRNNRVVYCALFVNNNGDYFLALPFLMHEKEEARLLLNENTPIIKSTLLQIQQILDKMPLCYKSSTLDSDDMYLNKFKRQYMIPAILDEMNDHSSTYSAAAERKRRPIASITYDISRYLGVSYDTVHNVLKINKIKSRTTDFPECSLDVGTDLISLLGGIDDDYKNHFMYDLEDLLIASVDSSGEYHFALKNNSNKAWTELLDSINIHSLLNYNDNHILPEWSEAFYTIASIKVTRKISIPKQHTESKVERIQLDNNKDMKSLMPATGLNKIFTSMSLGKDHRYFIDNKKIRSIFCSDQEPTIRYYEECKYDG